jgi:hypothetical protein
LLWEINRHDEFIEKSWLYLSTSRRSDVLET